MGILLFSSCCARFRLDKIIPEFKIASPGDPLETEMCLNFILDNPGPAY